MLFWIQCDHHYIIRTCITLGGRKPRSASPLLPCPQQFTFQPCRVPGEP